MSLRVRWWMVAVFLVGGLAGQEILRAHLTEMPLPASMALQLPLAALPRKIGSWQGEDLPVSADHRYADEHLKRLYHHLERKQSLTLWAVYSRDAADRKHHPEVCMAVAGRQEERDARQTLELAGPGDPAQRFQYRSLAGPESVFYWHYTLPVRLDPRLGQLQRVYQRARCPASSVTLEVFATCLAEEDLEAVEQFVRDLDVAVRRHVGREAVRGSERSRILVTSVATDD